MRDHVTILTTPRGGAVVANVYAHGPEHVEEFVFEADCRAAEMMLLVLKNPLLVFLGVLVSVIMHFSSAALGSSLGANQTFISMRRSLGSSGPGLMMVDLLDGYI
jgi:hypothetical protein